MNEEKTGKLLIMAGVFIGGLWLVNTGVVNGFFGFPIGLIIVGVAIL